MYRILLDFHDKVSGDKWVVVERPKKTNGLWSTFLSLLIILSVLLS